MTHFETVKFNISGNINPSEYVLGSMLMSGTYNLDNKNYNLGKQNTFVNLSQNVARIHNNNMGTCYAPVDLVVTGKITVKDNVFDFEFKEYHHKAIASDGTELHSSCWKEERHLIIASLGR